MNLRTNYPLGDYNTLALEACAEAYAAVTDDGELREALSWARERELPVVVLGAGSNIVLAGNLRALVIHQQFRGIEVLASDEQWVRVRVGAGENWHELVRWCLERGYYGLENLALIPGTVGAAPVQNIGAYGVELQSVFVQLHAVDIADGRDRVLDREACQFGYRDSIFKRGLRDKTVITAVELRLSLSPAVNISYPTLADWFAQNPETEVIPETVFDAVVDIRSTRLPDPTLEPNAGSFFKNPVLTPDQTREVAEKAMGLPIYPQPDGNLKVPAAWFIDQCGWKGLRRNGVGVHDHHALVLVNDGSNSGVELLSLATEIAASVHDRFGVDLEMEPRIYGGEE